MKLNLNKPIVFFDIEATGLDVAKDHIVELCYIKLYPNGNKESNTMRIKPVDSLGNIIHISEEASKVNGIHDEDLINCPTFKDIADDLLNVFENSDLAGYNSNYFDIPLLVEEFLRIGKNIDLRNCNMIDVCTIYKKMERRDLSAAYKFYCNKELKNAHTALADTEATLEILEAQLDTYSDNLNNNIKELAEFSKTNRNADFAGRIIKNEQDKYIFNFGKYKDQDVTEVFRKDPAYFNWIIRGDFTLNTKQVIRKIKLMM